MDRCLLKNGDLDRLFEWRDNNKELVKRAPMPIKGIRIAVEEEKAELICVRKNDVAEIRCNLCNGEKILIVVNVLPCDGKYTVKRTRPIDVDVGLINEACSIYFSLMALITYGDGIEYSDEELGVLDSAVKENFKARLFVKQHNTQQQSITYLLRRDAKGRLSVGGRGHHSSPKGEFGVRGHFRHYADGKVVWIAEYKKGKGKRKDKEFRL